MSDPRFPSLPQSLAIAVGLLVAQWVGAAVMHALAAAAGAPTLEARVTGALLADGVLAWRLTHVAGLTVGRALHDGPSSPLATAAVLLPPVLLVAPLYVLGVGLAVEQVEQWWPPSEAERAMFRALAPEGPLMLLLLCAAAPVLEEWVFRGLILRGLRTRYTPAMALWASALLFGASHLNLYQGLAGVLLGLGTGWLYLRSRSLIPGIALHAVYNALLVAFDALADDPPGDDAPMWSPPLAGWLLVVLLALVGLRWLQRCLAPASR